MKLYVEGGGDTNSLRTACREGFSEFLKKAGLKGHMPRIVACGGRQQAYDDFCTAIANGDEAFLLVDSEGPVRDEYQEGEKSAWMPWGHLQARDHWVMPDQARNQDCHLMVQCTENWFLADRRSLVKFFGQGFNENRLPALAGSVEIIPKLQVYQALDDASRACKTKGRYGKGEHSFKLLANIEPSTVFAASPWAERFCIELKRKMNAL